MTDFLAAIVAAKRREVAERRRQRPLETLADRGPGVERDAPRDFSAALAVEGLSVVAEFKRRSPSRGALRPAADAAVFAGTYERNGATAVSVVTDRPFFGGCEDDLLAVRKATRLPILRKDFTVDAYQVYESWALGADAVLLIARILPDTRLSEWIDLCRQLRLTALVEVHDENDLEMALQAGAPAIGVNSRDLRTFRTDLAVAARLRPLSPEDTPAVAESGIHSPADVRAVRQAGFDACLIGEALMAASDPGRALRELLSGGTAGTS